MPSICVAAFRASSGVPARLMPPALPRLPAGTCALITQGPSLAAAMAASAAFVQRTPCGSGMPAARKTNDLAACSSKFITNSHLPCIDPRPNRQPFSGGHLLFAIFLPIRAEQRFLTRLVFRDGGDEVGDIEEIHIVQIVCDTVAAPGPATHAEREVQTVVEPTAIAECVRLVDQYTHNVRAFGEQAAAADVLGVQTD